MDRGRWRLLSLEWPYALIAIRAAAREHACYPYVARQLGGHVPKEVTRTLAHERGTRKQVGGYKAPVGYYFRPLGTSPADVTEIRTVVGTYELARCPAAPLPLPAGATPAPRLPSTP